MIKSGMGSVTAAENGMRALEYLGLLGDDDQHNTPNTNVSTKFHSMNPQILITSNDTCMKIHQNSLSASSTMITTYSTPFCRSQG